MDTAMSTYSDCAFIQAGVDVAFSDRLGRVTSVEVNFDGPSDPSVLDQAATVRITSDRGVSDFQGLRLAVLKDGEFHWATALKDSSQNSPQPDSDLVRGLARRLVDNRPAVLVAQGEHEALVAVDFLDIYPDPRPSILAGLEKHSGMVDERRAVAGLANYLGIPAAQRDSLALFDGSHIADLPGGLSARDVLADAHFLAAEHNFFLEARFPQLTADLDPGSARTVVTTAHGSVTVMSHLIATLSGDTFTWAWADRAFSASPAAAAAANLRRFGRDHAVPELLRPRVPIAVARRSRLPQLAMPITNLWTLIPVRLPDSRQGLALSDAPAFRLPAPTPAATQGTLEVPVPPGVDEQRARAAYQRLRNQF